LPASRSSSAIRCADQATRRIARIAQPHTARPRGEDPGLLAFEGGAPLRAALLVLGAAVAVGAQRLARGLAADRIAAVLVAVAVGVRAALVGVAQKPNEQRPEAHCVLSVQTWPWPLSALQVRLPEIGPPQYWLPAQSELALHSSASAQKPTSTDRRRTGPCRCMLSPRILSALQVRLPEIGRRSTARSATPRGSQQDLECTHRGEVQITPGLASRSRDSGRRPGVLHRRHLLPVGDGSELRRSSARCRSPWRGSS
jgi:hypothetical protein